VLDTNKDNPRHVRGVVEGNAESGDEDGDEDGEEVHSQPVIRHLGIAALSFIFLCLEVLETAFLKSLSQGPVASQWIPTSLDVETIGNSTEFPNKNNALALSITQLPSLLCKFRPRRLTGSPAIRLTHSN